MNLWSENRLDGSRRKWKVRKLEKKEDLEMEWIRKWLGIITDETS